MKLVNAEHLEWEDPPRGYYLTDVKQKVLWENKETGAMMALVKFPAGVADKIHSHPHANQFIYGLQGAIENDAGVVSSIEGIFAYAEKDEAHGATRIAEETILLFYWDGPPTPRIADDCN